MRRALIVLTLVAAIVAIVGIGACQPAEAGTRHTRGQLVDTSYCAMGLGSQVYKAAQCVAVLTFTPQCTGFLISVDSPLGAYVTGPPEHCPFTSQSFGSIIWSGALPGTARVNYVKVRVHDTLWRIAIRAYGNGHLWNRIARTNGVDPRFIHRGQVLIIPPVSS